MDLDEGARREEKMQIGVLCETRPGLRDSERSIAIPDFWGRKQYIRIEAYYLHEHEGRTYMPLTFIDEDAEKVLVELPYEADSGKWRLFVSKKNVLHLEDGKP